MRVERIHVENFKAFDEFDLSLIDESTGRPFDLVALTGENGTGKSSVLEAIATAYESGHPGESFRMPADAIRSSQRASRVEVDVSFTENEVAELLDSIKFEPEIATRVLMDIQPAGLPSPIPSRLRCISTSAPVLAEARVRYESSAGGVFRVQRHAGALRWAMESVAGWRIVYLLSSRRVEPRQVDQVQKLHRPRGSVLRQNGYSDLKQHLVDLEWVRLKRLDRGGGDPIAPFAALASSLFEGKSFVGVSEDNRVVFRTEDGVEFDFDQLSSGEQAILALFGAMIRSELRHCVYLIDEPEQHLHPKWQRVLPEILKDQAARLDSQFILATHSVEVAEEVQRLGGAVFSLSPRAEANAPS